MGIEPRTEHSKFISSEKRKYFDNVRGDCDIFCRGLIDGYRLEQERLHRMMKEKDDEKKLDRKVKNMMKEWEKNTRLGIEKEILEARRVIGDSIETYKILSGKEDNDSGIYFLQNGTN